MENVKFYKVLNERGKKYRYKSNFLELWGLGRRPFDLTKLYFLLFSFYAFNWSTKAGPDPVLPAAKLLINSYPKKTKYCLFPVFHCFILNFLTLSGPEPISLYLKMDMFCHCNIRVKLFHFYQVSKIILIFHLTYLNICFDIVHWKLKLDRISYWRKSFLNLKLFDMF